MKNFENNLLNIGQFEPESDDSKNFNELIEKLKENKSIFADTLESLSEQDREDFDVIVLNPIGLSWGVFKTIESDTQNKVLELINKFKSADSREVKKQIGAEIGNLIE